MKLLRNIIFLISYILFFCGSIGIILNPEIEHNIYWFLFSYSVYIVLLLGFFNIIRYLIDFFVLHHYT